MIEPSSSSPSPFNSIVGTYNIRKYDEKIIELYTNFVFDSRKEMDRYFYLNNI